MGSGSLVELTITGTLAVILFLIGYVFLRTSRKKKRVFYEKTLRCTEQVEAEVEKIEEVLEKNTGNYHAMYYPVYTYRINNSNYTTSQKSKIGIKPGKLKQGQRVILFYNPNNPADFYVPVEDNTHTCRVLYNISLIVRATACLTFLIGILVTALLA